MQFEELHKKIADQLCLSAHEKEELKNNFPDLKNLKNDEDAWDGQDVVDFFGRERRGNRTQVNELLNEYLGK